MGQVIAAHAVIVLATITRERSVGFIAAAQNLDSAKWVTSETSQLRPSRYFTDDCLVGREIRAPVLDTGRWRIMVPAGSEPDLSFTLTSAIPGSFHPVKAL